MVWANTTNHQSQQRGFNNSGGAGGAPYDNSTYCFMGKFNDATAFFITHASLLMGLLGIPANILAILVLRRDPSKTTTRFLLMALAWEDLGLILLYLIYYILGNYNVVYHLTALDISVIESPVLFLVNWCKIVEIYTVVLVSLDRYIAIRFPLKAASICRVSNALRGLLIVVMVSFLLKLPNLILDYKVVVYDKLCNVYYLKALFGEHSWHLSFRIVYIQFLDQIFTYLIPLTSLIVLNTCLIQRLRSADSERGDSLNELKSLNYMRMSASRSYNLSSVMTTTREETKSGKRYGTPRRRWSTQRRTITLTLIGIITIFIFCETPTSLIFFNSLYYLIRDGNDDGGAVFLNAMYPCALLLMLANCASNFFVYILIGRKFRRIFLHLFCRCCRAGRRQSREDIMMSSRPVTKATAMDQQQANKFVGSRKLPTFDMREGISGTSSEFRHMPISDSYG